MNSQIRLCLATVATLLTMVAIWGLQNPYGEISYNDASLYTFFALARLHPGSLGTDVFLRFGSQDAYTVFSPLYAAAIELFGLERAAALGSFLAQLAFYFCGWQLARTFMPARQALLAVGLLIALPSDYGSGQVFHYVESFLTPRQFAEAATLAGLAALLSRRRALAVVCLLLTLMLHPVMAVAGMVLFLCLQIGIPRPRPALAAAAGVGLLALLPVLIVPYGSFAPFDTEWLKLSDSAASYLFMSEWHAEDWARLVVPVALLAAGAATNTDPTVRRLSLAAILAAACSMAVGWVFVDLLHSVIFTQLQPWRWFWLVQCLAVLLTPAIVRDCWQSGPAGRGGLVLLGATWVLSRTLADTYAASACVALACLGASAVIWLRTVQVRPLATASWLLFVSAILMSFAFKLQYIPVNPGSPGHWLRLDPAEVHTWGGDGIAYAAVLVLVWSFIKEQAGALGPIAACAAAVAICGIVVPATWQSWSAKRYPDQQFAAFSSWREVIPAHAEVVWPRTPMGTWYLLERPSYYSAHQVAGDIFSRAKAIEIHRRAAHVAQALKLASPHPTDRAESLAMLASSDSQQLPHNADNLNEKGLFLLCADPALGFYVSQVRLNLPAAAPVITPNPLRPRNQYHLYRCTDVRESGAG